MEFREGRKLWINRRYSECNKILGKLLCCNFDPYDSIGTSLKARSDFKKIFPKIAHYVSMGVRILYVDYEKGSLPIITAEAYIELDAVKELDQKKLDAWQKEHVNLSDSCIYLNWHHSDNEYLDLKYPYWNLLSNHDGIEFYLIDDEKAPSATTKKFES